MNLFKNISFRRKIALVFCAVFASLALAVGLVLPGIIDNAYAEKGGSVAVTAPSPDGSVEDEVEIKPNHDYHTLSVSLRDAAKIYVNKTTAGQLKNNLIVNGSFNVGSNTPTVKLKPDEYSVSYSVGVYSGNFEDSDILFTAVPTSTVTFTVTANGITASFVVSADSGVIVEDEVPLYASIEVANLNNISSDYTAETLIYADGFSVVGVYPLAEGETEARRESVTNFEFIEVEMSPITDINSEHEFTVSYLNPDGTKLSTKGTITGITRPQLLTAVLQVKPEYTQKGNYWYDGDKSVFVIGMSRSDFLSGLKLTVYYANGEKQLDLSDFGSGASYVFDSWGTVSLPNDYEFNSQLSEITLPLSVSVQGQNAQYQIVTVSVTVALEMRQVTSIAIDPQYLTDGVDDKNNPVKIFNYSEVTTVADKNLYPYSAVSLLADALTGKVIATYNDGSTGVLNNGLGISGNLTPTVQAVIDCKTNKKDTYSKTVSLTYGTVSTPLTVKVVYKDPESIPSSSFTVTSLATQYMRTPFNLSGIYVNVEYIVGGSDGDYEYETMQLPVADFVNEKNEYVQILYRNSNDQVIEGLTEFNKDVTSVQIRFRYNITDSWKPAQIFRTTATTGNRLNVEKLPLSLPDIGVLNVNYSQNLTKNINFSENFDTQTLNNILTKDGITITDEAGNATDNATVDGQSVSFTAAGTYKLHFKINSADTDEVRWDESNLPNGVEIVGDELVYTIVVSPSEVKVQVRLNETETIYGTEIVPEIWLAPLGTNDWFKLTEDIKSQTGTSSTIRYYGAGNTIYSVYPKNVGVYYVQAEITSTAYKAEPSDGPNYADPDFGAPRFEILPKQLDAGKVNSFVYDRNDRHISDFLTSSGFEYDDTANTQINGKTILTVDGKPDGYITDKVYRHKNDSEKITLQINSTNYYWTKDSSGNYITAQEISITITALELELEIVGGEYLDFVYGGSKNGSEMSELPTPTLNKTPNGTGFYAETVTEYYLVEDFDTDNGAPKSGVTALTVADFKKWDYKGENGYVLYIKTQKAEQDKDGDYNLPTHFVTFTVSRSQIDLVEFAADGGNDEYDSSLKTLNLSNWQNGKMTAAVTSTVTIVDTIVDNTSGTITVKHAGDYTITVSLDDNYDWNATDGETNHYDVTFTYTVDKKELDIQLDDSRFNYDGNSHRPTVSLTGVSATELDITETKLYSDENLQTELSAAPSAIGTYYIAVTSWTAQVAGDFDVSNNYTISSLPFSIVTTAMAKPELTNGSTTVTETYKSTGFDFTDYIKGYAEKYTYAQNVSKLKIEITAETNGRRDMTDVNIYTVVITPADNFKWDTEGNDNDTSPVEFTFTITPLKLTGLQWGTTTFTYDGTVQVPSVTLQGIYEVDSDYVSANVSGAQTDAGVYTATATGLKTGTEGDRNFNYALPDNGTTSEFTIAKRSINTPTYNTETELTFGKDSSLAFNTDAGFTGVEGWSWDNVVEVSILPTDGTSFTFDENTGKFNFINAGTYTVTFTINDASFKNYSWNGVEGKVYTPSDIVVNKLAITAPSISGDATNATFGGSSQSLAFNTAKVEGFTAAWSDVVSYTVAGVYAFDSVNVPHSATDGIADGTSFTFGENTGAFNFVNAGTYTITFAIKSDKANNYCWADTSAVSQTVNVSRMQITAPKLIDPDDGTKSGRTIEYNGNPREPKLDWNESSAYTITYGQFLDNDYVNENSEHINYGQYYVCIRLNGSDAVNPLNYVFIKNTDDKIPTYVSGEDKAVYSYKKSKADVCIYLNYAITKKIFTVDYSGGNYSFGNNGYFEKYDKPITQGVVNHTANGSVSTDYFFHLLESGDYEEVIKNTFTINFNFYSLNSLNDRREDGTAVKEDNLVNGLPWNSGIYGVYILLEFAEDVPFEDIPVWTTFEVTQLEITEDLVKWYNGETELSNTDIPEFVYDNTEHNLVATITDVPQKTSGGTSEQAPVPVVVNADGGGLPVNASDMAYTLKVGSIKDLTVDGVTSALAGNFKINGEFTHKIKINKRAITVNVTSGGTSEYGYELATLSDNWWDYATGSNEFADVSHKAFVTYKLQQNGTDVEKYNAGNYDIVAVLPEDGSQNYTLVCEAKGTYKITPREITLTLNSDNASKTYGTEVNLYNPAVYNVEYKGEICTEEQWLAQGDTRAQVFEVTSAASAANADAGTYDITITQKGNGNYIVTAPEKWEKAYTVNNAEITVGSVSGSSWEYNASERALIGNADTDNAAITVSGLVLAGDVTQVKYEYSKDGGATWTSADGVKLKDVADSGTYKIKITATNHNVKTLNGVTVTVYKATLTVGLELEIFYGEDSPVTHNFLMQASNLSDSRYTVTDFAGAEGSKETLDDVKASGSLSYTTDYDKNAVAGKYTLTLDLNNLSSPNYGFEAGESRLIVNERNITVSVSDITAQYWSLVNGVSPVYSNITLSSSDNDTYSDGMLAVPSAKEILTYYTDAINVDDNDIVTYMNSVNSYTVTVSSGDIAGKYIINSIAADNTQVATASFEITPADLYDYGTVSGYEGAFDQDYHTITVDGGFAQTYNPEKNELQVKYCFANTEINDFINVVWSDELPTFIHVGTYYLYYKLSATNHNSETRYAVIEITPNDNSFTVDFGFENKPTFGAENEVNADSWIYGIGHDDGYESKGEITEPEASYNLKEDGTFIQPTFSLYYNGELITVNGTSVYSTANELFTAVLQAGLFNAGTYRIHYEMAGTQNFNEVSGDRYFRVGKKSLTITADSVTVIYGEDVSSDKYSEMYGFAYTVEGLVSSGLIKDGYDKDTVANVFEGGVLPKFTSTYAKGYENGSVKDGGYSITLENESELTELNYEVTLSGNILTVAPREITVTVDDKQSKYNYNEASGNKITDVNVEGGRQTLSFSQDITFYSEDGEVIELVTSAVDVDTTLDVGVYPIFVRFTDAKHAINYNITVVGSFTKELADGATDNTAVYGKTDYYQFAIDDYAKHNSEERPVITNSDGSSCLGTYTIVAANLKLKENVLNYWDDASKTFVRYSETENIPREAQDYDGKYKGYTREPEGSNFGNLTITAKYSLDGGKTFTENYVKDAGTYRYIFEIDDTNYVYVVGDNQSLIIYQKSLSMSATLDGETEFLSTQTYKNDNYTLEFTFDGMQGGEIIELIASVNATPCANSDSTFNTILGDIYGTFANVNDEGKNVYTLKVKNAGVYEIGFKLKDTQAMKNYSFGNSYKFTVSRASLTVKSNNSVVQYGTEISSNEAQVMEGVIPPANLQVTGDNWNTVADHYRFFGFSLEQGVIDKSNSEDYFHIGGVTYSVKGYDAATTDVYSNGQHRVFNIVPDKNSIHAFNYEIVTELNNSEYGKLHLAQRRINVTLNGYNANSVDATSFASKIYSGIAQQPDNDTRFYTPENKWYGAALGDNNRFLDSTHSKLSVENAINAGDYVIHAYQDDSEGGGITNNTNYLINFINNDEALFHIAKKDITLQVVSTDGNYTFDITYGDSTDGYYKVVYSGFVTEDGGKGGTPVDRFELANGSYSGEIIFTEMFTNDGSSPQTGVYAAWGSHAGERYLIGVDKSTLLFDNYNIAKYESALMTVVARKVTATTSDRVYTEDTDLHGGAYGIEHDAVIVFTDVKDANVTYAGKDYAPNKYLSYMYVGKTFGGEKYNSSTAPTKAGSYEVTITLNTNQYFGDYVLDLGNVTSNTTTLSYNVTKKAISLNWDSSMLEDLVFNEGDNKWVDIKSVYVNALTVAYPVQLIRQDNSVVTLSHSANAIPGDGEYVVNDEKFSVKIYSVGTYSVVLTFNSDAVNNYKWDEEDTLANLSLAFSVYADSFRITNLYLGSWTYNDAQEHIPTYVLTNGVDVPLTFRYATVLGELPENVKVGVQFNGEIYDSINKTSPGANIPVNAGTYILVANYTGNQYSSTSAYVVFTISPREVSAPVFVQSEEKYVYNGSVQTADIKYNPREVTGVYSGNSSLGTDGITLSATDANTYRITFTLNDARNYKWADGVTAGTSYSVEWVISPATDNKVVWGKEIKVTYGETIALTAQSTYGGALTDYYFALRNSNHAVPPAGLEWTEWTEDNAPVNSGSYWVKAVDGGNGNYNASEGVQKITIDKAWLTVTANGYATYGSDERTFGYEISGFVRGEEAITVGEIEYVLEEADKYVAGVYGVWLKYAQAQINGKNIVEGMGADNYYITSAVGEFIVHRRNVTVILGSARSVYGNLIDLSGIEIRVVTENGLAAGDTVEDLTISLEIDADRNVDIQSLFNNVGAYTVNAVGYENNANYNVTVFGSGTYTIAPLSIFITAESGGGTYGSDDIRGAEITGIYAIVDGEQIDVREVFGDKAPTFRFNYWGVSNDGKWNKINNDNWTEEPDRAGTYHATAVASNSDNFTLLTNMGTPGVTFTVGKKVIDESLISIAKQAYANKALTPVITDAAYSGIYTAGEITATEVGVYNVPLTLTDPYNYKWSSVEESVCNLSFEIVMGENEFTSKPAVNGWTYLGYDPSRNTPTADIKFGTKDSFVFTYSTSENGEYSANIPVSAGKYWVKITVPQTNNYYAVTSDPVQFEISKATIGTPSIVTLSEGVGQNTVYTGSRLQAAVEGYDARMMRIIYGGDTLIENSVAVFAVNAGTYAIRFSLNDADNYAWTDETELDADGNAVLYWTVARKKLAKPTMTSDMYMVNGKTLTFIPDGFDEQTMDISGNRTSYGGAFDVTVSLKDPSNYEWADSSVEDVTLVWVVVGWDTVFIIVVSVLGVIAGVAGIAIGIQYLVHRRKKIGELALETASAEAVQPQSAENAQPGNVQENNAQEDVAQKNELKEKNGGNENE